MNRVSNVPFESLPKKEIRNEHVSINWFGKTMLVLLGDVSNGWDQEITAHICCCYSYPPRCGAILGNCKYAVSINSRHVTSVFAMPQLIQRMCFQPPNLHFYPFSHTSKTTSNERKYFAKTIWIFFPNCWVFPAPFSDAIVQKCAEEQEDGNPATESSRRAITASPQSSSLQRFTTFLFESGAVCNMEQHCFSSGCY